MTLLKTVLIVFINALFPGVNVHSALASLSVITVWRFTMHPSKQHWLFLDKFILSEDIRIFSSEDRKQFLLFQLALHSVSCYSTKLSSVWDNISSTRVRKLIQNFAMHFFIFLKQIFWSHKEITILFSSANIFLHAWVWLNPPLS